MFERFTKDARAVVEGAVGYAQRADADHVDEEHLLLSLFDREGSRGSFALASLGLTERREEVEHDLAESRRRGGLSRADAEALSGLGIDLSQVVARLEDAHGEGVLSTAGGGGRRRGRRGPQGHTPFSRGAKDLLTRSLRIAVSHRDRYIGDQHLLLALTARPGLPAEVLADRGATYEAVTRVLYGKEQAG